jgi:hypothetical protein
MALLQSHVAQDFVPFFLGSTVMAPDAEISRFAGSSRLPGVFIDD